MKKTVSILCAVSAVLLSIPWLIPHTGPAALFALVPLLCAERIASGTGMKRFWLWHYGTFVLWNAITTFWVCNATVGGGIFAVLVNAAEMSLIFGLFRLLKRRTGGVLPYVFLAAAWVAWEYWYFNYAEISWPWLVLGNAFAESTRLVQWYSLTGVLGGSLWIWASNLAVFGIMAALSEGTWFRWNGWGRGTAAAAAAVVIAVPAVCSLISYSSYEEQSSGTVDVVIGQPDFDPYEKFESLTQSEQNAVLLGLWEEELRRDTVGTGVHMSETVGQLADVRSSAGAGTGSAAVSLPLDPTVRFAPGPPSYVAEGGTGCRTCTGAGDNTTGHVLLLAPETFTSDIWLNDPALSPTLSRFRDFQRRHPGCDILFGASTNRLYQQRSAPTILARKYGDGWRTNHNSAILSGADGHLDIYHKSKLVVGTELTPYPRVFVPIERMLCRMMGVSGLMGHCEGQDKPAALRMADSVRVGCAVCYESVYGGHCAGYVRDGAEFLTVITNDAWWGDTPGYRQHFSYSRLRAIELRRDVARCGNTGLSGFIDQRGDVVEKGPWWERAVLRGEVNLNSGLTFYASHGDWPGRVCVFIAVLVLLASVVMRFKR